MKPEEIAEIKLYNWLRPFVDEIYFNRKNILNAPIFKVKGRDKKAKCPDFLIKSAGRYFVIEVKPNQRSNLVNQGSMQLFDRYWIEYNLGYVTYIVDNGEIDISSFLFATESSISGHLYLNKETLVDNLKEASETKMTCILKYKTIPRFEFTRTQQLVRLMFSKLKEFRKKRTYLELTHMAGYGILILNVEKGQPYMYHMAKLKQWQQHYWKL